MGPNVSHEDLARGLAQPAVRGQGAQVLRLVQPLRVQGLREQALVHGRSAGSPCSLGAEALKGEGTRGRRCDGRLAIETALPTDGDQTDTGRP